MATNLVIPSDIESRSAQQKADFYGQQRMAGFSDPAIRNAVSSVVGPQSDDDWGYLLNLSGYGNVGPDEPRGSNPFGNSLIAALRNNTMPASGNASSFSMIPNRATAPAPAPVTRRPTPNYLNTISPFTPPDSPMFVGPPLPSPAPSPRPQTPTPSVPTGPIVGPTPAPAPAPSPAPTPAPAPTSPNVTASPQQQFYEVGVAMPSDWASRNPAQRIDYLNEQDVTPQHLEYLGYSPGDIEWMVANGLGDTEAPEVIGPSQPAVTQAPATAPVTITPTTQPAQQRDVASMLPSNWGQFGATQKINWFNQNNVNVDELMQAGVPQSDIDWMLRNGYAPSSGGAMDDFMSLYELQER